MRYYTNETLIGMLEKLSIEQIEEVKKEFKKIYPESHIYLYLCDLAIGRIQVRQRREEFVNLIEKYKNAPSDAGTPEQGNATINPTRKTDASEV